MDFNYFDYTNLPELFDIENPKPIAEPIPAIKADDTIKKAMAYLPHLINIPLIFSFFVSSSMIYLI